jgi:hypothetical protein
MTDLLTQAELGGILVSLQYSKKKISETPICIPGQFVGICYPDYSFKRQRLDDIDRLIARVREVIAGMREAR